jgi:D-amino peptidase
MEGASGVAGGGMTSPKSQQPKAFPRGQRFSTDDIKAAIYGILEVDPSAEILYNDTHGLHAYYEEFPENVRMVVNSGELLDEVLGIDDTFDALICIGSHGHSTIAHAVLCHVWDVREVEFNQKSLTETGLNAALAGYYGVPLVAVSGDKATMEYIQQNLSPKIAVAVVKEGISRLCTITENPKKAQRIIKEAVIDGLQRRNEIPPITFNNPITVDITYKDEYGASANKFFVPSDERIAGDKVRFIAPDAKEAYYGFLARDKLSKIKNPGW